MEPKMPPDMSEAEMKFFETGELPPELAPTEPEPIATPASASPEVADPITEPTSAPLDMAALERLFDAKIEALRAQLAPQAPTPKIEELPDENIDPLGNMMQQLKRVNAALEQQTSAQQQLTLKQQLNDFTTSVQASKAAFEATTPDFKDAYAHIRNLRTEDLRSAGAPEKDIPQILLQDEFQLAQTAISRGKNPAEEMYAMAKRYGYTPKAQSAQPIPPAAKMDQLKAGQAAFKNPDRAASDSELTLEGLKDMSGHDLNRLVQDPKLWATLVGGASGPDIF